MKPAGRGCYRRTRTRALGSRVCRRFPPTQWSEGKADCGPSAARVSGHVSLLHSRVLDRRSGGNVEMQPLLSGGPGTSRSYHLALRCFFPSTQLTPQTSRASWRPGGDRGAGTDGLSTAPALEGPWEKQAPYGFQLTVKCGHRDPSQGSGKERLILLWC